MEETKFNILTSTGTRQPEFGRPSNTRDDQVGSVPRENSEPAGLAHWLTSAEVKKYEGQWVLLTDDYEVKDSAPTPSELLNRHPEEMSPFIVFVRPPNVTYVV